jgi:uncharacterized protein
MRRMRHGSRDAARDGDLQPVDDPRTSVPAARSATAETGPATATGGTTTTGDTAATGTRGTVAEAEPADRRAAREAEARAPATGPLTGDPSVLGLPSFIAGSVVLGLVLIGAVPALAVGASLPIILAAASAGLFLATIWAAFTGQNAVAAIFGVFAGFWFSYALLLLGLMHGWFGILPGDVARTEEAFLITWIVVIGLLMLGTLRLPMAFTAVLVLVEVALILLLIATYQSSSGLTKAAGYVALVFAAVGAWVYLGAATKASGGKHVPLGRAVWRSAAR